MKKLHPKHDATDDQTTCITNLEMPVCPPDITENVQSILPLPIKQRTSRTQATKCREVLNHLRNLNFLVHEEEPLTALYKPHFSQLFSSYNSLYQQKMALLLKIKSLTRKTNSSHFHHRPQPRQKQTPSCKEKEREISTLAGLQASKSNIANPNGWLTDSEIHAAQQLLKTQFPYVDGLIDPDILSGDLVTPAVTEFV
ncbi:hypothetical protein AWC38_SpisGene22395 [Stylophora pistillata]|uniref:Uncharacterized protein n=1 Tax=Stylophora pistillata TaxID=50429 RepID=A0A2B4R598_STYPI|nr:hypothetical protein AWC38_SpisGene22395 [Stylophora pistillata]